MLRKSPAFGQTESRPSRGRVGPPRAQSLLRGGLRPPCHQGVPWRPADWDHSAKAASIKQLLVQIGRIRRRAPLTAFELDGRDTRDKEMAGRRDYPDYPSHPSGSAIRLAPALFRAPRAAVELRIEPRRRACDSWKRNGRAGEIIPITPFSHRALPLGSRPLSFALRALQSNCVRTSPESMRLVEKKWSGRRDSNSRPPRPERGALPS